MNTVKVTFDVGSQTYHLSVNGGDTGPFSCGLSSAQAFRVNYQTWGQEERALAWFDSVSIASDGTTLLDVDFDSSFPGPDHLCEVCHLDAMIPDLPPNPPPLSGNQLSVVDGPVSQTVGLGQTATFRVSAAGKLPLSYQWEFNRMPIEGATDATLKIVDVRPELQGSYDTVVTDAQGSSVRTERAVLSLLESGGTVIFSNRMLPDINAPVFGEDGVTPLEGDQFFAQLYGGVTMDTLIPIGPAVPFRTGGAAGYWFLVPDSLRTIATVTPGEAAFVQVRAWETGYGSTFEQTLARGGPVGASTILQIKTGGGGVPPGLPASLLGLASFQLTRNLRPELIGSTNPTDWPNGGATGARLAIEVMNHSIRFSIAGQAGNIFEIQRSSDLVRWEPDTRILGANASLVFREFIDQPSSSRQFYRVFAWPGGGQ